MTPAPTTAHMSNFDPIPRLQQIVATIEDGGHFDSPATAAHYIRCAIREIERLQKERDDARIEVCRLLARNRPEGTDGSEPGFHATARGWNCFYDESFDDVSGD